jgi:hypothetical protein
MTVIINGRTAVHKESGGTLTTQDVCLTTDNKIPVTYNNIAKSADADNEAQTVFVNGNRICHKNSIFSKSTGDENGDHKGRNSGTIQGKAEFVTASTNVFIEGIPAVRQGDLMVSNNRNTPPAQLQQPGVAPQDSNHDTNQETLNEPTQPDQINIDVAGVNIPLLSGTIFASVDKHYVLLGQDAENNGVLKRLEIRNLKPDKYNLYLSVVNTTGQPIKIPLSNRVATKRSKDRQPEIGQAGNILVPVMLRYRDANGAVEQLRAGWLYVFKNNYLWRELRIINSNRCSVLKEVDLTNQAGRDERIASGEGTFYLTMPHKINGRMNQFGIAYSKSQWNWSIINDHGGMNPDDERIKGKDISFAKSNKEKNHQDRIERIHLELFVNILYLNL